VRFHRRAGHQELQVEAPDDVAERIKQHVRQMNGNPRAPHCDSTILHAPGECTYCDGHPDWQHLRVLWRVNFTGHHDVSKAPCPSTYSRPEEVRDAWDRNRPVPS